MVAIEKEFERLRDSDGGVRTSKMVLKLPFQVDELLYTHPKIKESTGADLITLEDQFFDNEIYFCIEMIRRKTKTERVSTGSVKYAMPTLK